MMSKKTYAVYLIAIGLILAYLLIINITANILSDGNSGSSKTLNKNNYGDVVLGVSDSIDVSVLRNRWYGTILEQSGTNTKLSKLYLFGFITLPINVNGSNLVWIHILFLMMVIGITYYSTNKMKKYYFERGYF